MLGAILPALQLAQDPANTSLFFIADLHSLTTVRDAATLRANTYAVAAAWLACGFEVENERNLFYRQSDVPQVTELTWYLSCLAPFPMLANAHSFKDKSNRLADVNAGLFTYPVLMAADILLYDAEIVPVGKDQVQHLEIARDIAGAFNRTYGETLVLPTACVQAEVQTVPGLDGQKMSKSYGNILDIFVSDKELLKTVRSIVTDSKGLDEPKDPTTDTVFRLFELVASASDVATMRQRYEAGGFGYGHAKQALYDVLTARFAAERRHFNALMADRPEVDRLLAIGADRAQTYGAGVLRRVRERMGLN